MWMLNMLPRWRRLRKGQTHDAIQTASAGCGGTGMVVSCRNLLLGTPYIMYIL